MILTDREIKLAVEKKQIVIEPPPGPLAFSSTAVDLTLDPHITVFKYPVDGVDMILDPGHPSFKAEAALREISTPEEIPSGGYELRHNTLLLAWTAEYLKLEYHNRVAARVEGKSSLARLGLGVHITAPTIHAGFQGRIRLEVVNHGPRAIRLRPGMKICQLIFEQTLGTPEKGYQGQFFDQAAH